MHFFKVPRLGAYLAIKLEYDSCLNERAYDSSVQDYMEVLQKQKEQEEEKRMYYEKGDDDNKSKGGEQEDETKYESANQMRSIEDRHWEDIVPKPFASEKVSYVVGLNTLGQDREFTQENMQFALKMVQMYKERWEEKEKMNLESDIMMRLDNANKDKKYKEVFENLDNIELEKQIEEELNLNEEIDLATIDEDAKSVLVNKIKLHILTR